MCSPVEYHFLGEVAGCEHPPSNERVILPDLPACIGLYMICTTQR